MLARNGERPATEWTMNGARKFSGIGNAETSKPTPEKSQVWALYYGDAGAPPAQVVADSLCPGIYRVAWPDGKLSDLANLTRCKDAAEAIWERGLPRRNARFLRWQFGPVRDAHRSPAIRPPPFAPPKTVLAIPIPPSGANAPIREHARAAARNSSGGNPQTQETRP